jgi:uncharacterized protein
LAEGEPLMAADWRASVVACIRAEALPVDKFGHQPRLYALAVQLAEDREFDDDILFAAAWMHDLGVFLGHRPKDTAELAKWNHIPYTLARSRELLAGWGFPASKLDAVAEAIRTHQPQDEPQQFEAILLHDADILEQLGAIGALRAIAKIGRDSRFPTFSAVLPVLRRAVESLPSRLCLESAKRRATSRVAHLAALLTAVEDEAGASLF